MESLTTRYFHARDVQPSFGELRAPHARLSWWAGLGQHSQGLWLTSVRTSWGWRKGTCGGVKGKGLGPVAPSEPLQGDGVGGAGLEAGDIHRAQCPRDCDVPGVFGAARLLHLQHEALKGPVCCCPGELETIPASLWHWELPQLRLLLWIRTESQSVTWVLLMWDYLMRLCVNEFHI